MKDKDDNEGKGGDAELLNSNNEPNESITSLERFFDGTAMNIIMTVITIIILFGDDFRIMYADKSLDLYFYLWYLLTFLLFLTELFVFSIVKSDYMWSFFFWLDLIATFSILFDIPFIMTGINAISSPLTVPYSSYSSPMPYDPSLFPLSPLTSPLPSTSPLYSLSSSSSSSSGGNDVTKTGRIVRLVRLIRLVRIVKLYKYFQIANNENDDEKIREITLSSLNKKQAELKKLETSRLGRLLSEKITRKTIIGLLLMLLVIPLLQVSSMDTSSISALRDLFWLSATRCSSQPSTDTAFVQLQCQTPWLSSNNAWKNLLFQYSTLGEKSEFNEYTASPLLWLRIPDYENASKIQDITQIYVQGDGVHPETERYWESTPLCHGVSLPSECPYRATEVEDVIYSPVICQNVDSCMEVTAYARFLVREQKFQEALRSIITTVVVCVLLATMSFLFNHDTQKYVIAPIEKMVRIVKELADDPLKKIDFADYTNGNSTNGNNATNELETNVLENTIIKIGTLLQIGFGEWGAEIISNNMRTGDGELDIMLPGRCLNVVMSVVNIKNFSSLCNVFFDERIFAIINNISLICNSCVSRWNGATIRNYGDGYLFIWRADSASSSGTNFASKTIKKSIPTQNPNNQNSNVSEIATKALISFVKTIAELNRNNSYLEFDRDGELRREVDRLLEEGEDESYLGPKDHPGEIEANEDPKPATSPLSSPTPSPLPTSPLSTSPLPTSPLLSPQDLAENKTLYDNLQKYQRKKRSPIQLACSLHYGRVIEGCIGTNMKIEVDYLSSHIILCEKMIPACRYYDVSILMSEQFYFLLPLKAKKRIRKIDNIYTSLIYESPANKAANNPANPANPANKSTNPNPSKPPNSLEHNVIGLYTLDILEENVPGLALDSGGNGGNGGKTWKGYGDIRKLDDLQDLPLDFIYNKGCEFVFHVDKDFEVLYDPGMDDIFLSTFRFAFCAFVAGEFKNAYLLFSKCLDMVPSDRPSFLLMLFIAQNGFQPPSNWQGFHSIPPL